MRSSTFRQLIVSGLTLVGALMLPHSAVAQTFKTDSVLMTSAAPLPASYCMNVTNQWYANASGALADGYNHRDAANNCFACNGATPNWNGSSCMAACSSGYSWNGASCTANSCPSLATGSGACSYTLPATASGGVGSGANTTLNYSGSASATCSAGSWGLISASCVAASCASISVGSGACAYTLPDTASFTSSTAPTSTPGYTGTYTGSCNLGVWSAVSASCGLICTSTPSANQTISCSSVAGSIGIPVTNTLGTLTYTTETASCTGNLGQVLADNGASACTAPAACVSAPSGNLTTSCSSVAGTLGIPAANTIGTLTYTTETASCTGNFGQVLAQNGASACSAPAAAAAPAAYFALIGGSSRWMGWETYCASFVMDQWETCYAHSDNHGWSYATIETSVHWAVVSTTVPYCPAGRTYTQDHVDNNSGIYYKCI